MITQEELQQNFYYDKDSGLFIWKKDFRKLKGSTAGTIHHIQNSSLKYVSLKFSNKRILAHRAAFIYVTGVLPKHKPRVREYVKSLNEKV